MKNMALFPVLVLLLIFWTAGNARGGYEGQMDPHFNICDVATLNTADGAQTVVTARVVNPSGPLPDFLYGLEVWGPGNFYYSFTPSDYYPAPLNYYRHTFPGYPTPGEYRFSAVNSYYRTSVSHCYLPSVFTIPVLDSSSFQAAGASALTPTLSWAASSTYLGDVFYRAVILDSSQNTVWVSGITSYTYATVPSGTLQAGQTYSWYVEAFDNTSAYLASYSISQSAIVPLSINNSRPYFLYTEAQDRHNSSGIVTVAKASLADPAGTVPGSIQSLTVTGPNGFNHTFDSSEYDPVWNEYTYFGATPPAAGIYTFTATTAGGTAVTYDYLRPHDIPLVDTSTFQASGDPTGPTLSWGAPANMDSPLYYSAWIIAPDGSDFWWSNMTTNTSVTVPAGTLQSGIAYQWKVRAHDSRYISIRNRSDSPYVPLSISNLKPWFSQAAVYYRNTADGFTIALDATLADPNGSPPDVFSSVTATGPGVFSYTFTAADFDPIYGQYLPRLPGRPADGVYTFTATDINGQSAVTHEYVHVGSPVPLPDASSIRFTGPSDAPLASWSAVSGYPGVLYYQLRVMNADGAPVYRSQIQPFTDQAIPTGVLVPGENFYVQVYASDSPDYIAYNTRSQTSEVPVKTWLDVASASAVIGGKARIPITLTNFGTTGISATSNDVTYNWSLLMNPRGSIGQAASDAGKNLELSDLGEYWDPIYGEYRGLVRAGALSMDPWPIGDGQMAVLLFDVKADATAQETEIGNTPSASTPDGLPADVAGTPGRLVIVSQCGDCDNTGIVTIANVQSAINMWGYDANVKGCVDFNGDGYVAINEVQMTVNNYLFGNYLASEEEEPPVAAAAKQTASLALANAQARPGQTISIPLKLSARGPVAALSSQITYDPAVFEGATATLGKTGATAGKNLQATTPRPGVLRVAALGLNRTAIKNGVALRINLTVRADAPFGPTTVVNAPVISSPAGDAFTVKEARGKGQKATVRITGNKAH